MEITAAVARKPSAEFTLERLDLDAPRPGEVLVEVAAVGLCHSDLAAREGVIPVALPAVLGHEGAGTVIEVGHEVTKVAVGDKVALSFNSCGRCANCALGAPAYCYDFMALNYAGVRPDGSPTLTGPEGAVNAVFFGQSSFASHALVPERCVVKLPADAPLDLVGLRYPDWGWRGDELDGRARWLVVAGDGGRISRPGRHSWRRGAGLRDNHRAGAAWKPPCAR
jgi:aryl-alcohol dehydrogenase